MKFENEYMKQRHANREKIEALGVDAYPGLCDRTHANAEIIAQHREKDRDALEAEPVEVAVVGRVMLYRHMG